MLVVTHDQGVCKHEDGSMVMLVRRLVEMVLVVLMVLMVLLVLQSAVPVLAAV